MSPGESRRKYLDNAQKSPEHSAPGKVSEIPSHLRPQRGAAALWDLAGTKVTNSVQLSTRASLATTG